MPRRHLDRFSKRWTLKTLKIVTKETKELGRRQQGKGDFSHVLVMFKGGARLHIKLDTVLFPGSTRHFVSGCCVSCVVAANEPLRGFRTESSSLVLFCSATVVSTHVQRLG